MSAQPASPTVEEKPRFVSAFLSHSSSDSALVEEVATHLVRRGVLAWLDKEELALGPLEIALKRAVEAQTTMVLFLSEAALDSDWCKDELRWALEAREGLEHLLPVYLGDPLKLVKRHDLLRSRFLHADGDRVRQLGYFDAGQPTAPAPRAVADKIAEAAYRRTIPEAWSEVLIVLDQRGDGPRRGVPTIPANLGERAIPALTFRPNLGRRKQRETLTGEDWTEVATRLSSSLSTALGTLRDDRRKVRVFGNSQTGLAWVVGLHFNRTTTVDLFGYDRFGNVFTNKGQLRNAPLMGGDPSRARLIGGDLAKPGENVSEVAIGVGPFQTYGDPVRKAVPSLPLLWIESGLISDSAEAMKLVEDLVASMAQLQQAHNVRRIALFWTTLNPVALLAAANLTHGTPTIRYMEWDWSRSEYVHLPMPNAT